MASSSASKESKAGPTGRAERRAPKAAHGYGAAGPEGGILALQQAAGNRAVTQAVQAGAGKGLPERHSRPSVGGGQALDPATLARMERAFDADFSDVRLHHNAAARAASSELDAVAFTRGTDIYLGEAAPRLDSTAGKQLIAHELAHVVQQRQARAIASQRVSQPNDSFERAADLAAAAAISGASYRIPAGGAPPAIQRLPSPSGRKGMQTNLGQMTQYVVGEMKDFEALAPAGSAWQVGIAEFTKGSIRVVGEGRFNGGDIHAEDAALDDMFGKLRKVLPDEKNWQGGTIRLVISKKNCKEQCVPMLTRLAQTLGVKIQSYIPSVPGAEGESKTQVKNAVKQKREADIKPKHDRTYSPSSAPGKAGQGGKKASAGAAAGATPAKSLAAAKGAKNTIQDKTLAAVKAASQAATAQAAAASKGKAPAAPSTAKPAAKGQKGKPPAAPAATKSKKQPASSKAAPPAAKSAGSGKSKVTSPAKTSSAKPPAAARPAKGAAKNKRSPVQAASQAAAATKGKSSAAAAAAEEEPFVAPPTPFAARPRTRGAAKSGAAAAKPGAPATKTAPATKSAPAGKSTPAARRAPARQAAPAKPVVTPPGPAAAPPEPLAAPSEPPGKTAQAGSSATPSQAAGAAKPPANAPAAKPTAAPPASAPGSAPASAAAAEADAVAKPPAKSPAANPTHPATSNFPAAPAKPATVNDPPSKQQAGTATKGGGTKASVSMEVPSRPPLSIGPSAKAQAIENMAVPALQLVHGILSYFAEKEQQAKAQQALNDAWPGIIKAQQESGRGVIIFFEYSQPEAHPDSAVTPGRQFESLHWELGGAKTPPPATLRGPGETAQFTSQYVPPIKEAAEKTDKSAAEYRIEKLWEREKVYQRVGERMAKEGVIGRFLRDRKQSKLDLTAVYDARAHLSSASIAIKQDRIKDAQASMDAAEELLGRQRNSFAEYIGPSFDAD